MPVPIIDDLSRSFPEAAGGTRWELLTDGVMGGLSSGRLTRELVAGRMANRMQGDVSLANNGGFTQMALDLAPSGETIDCRGFTGLEMDVWGNGEQYAVHLRTAELSRPWQSYRQSFVSESIWRTVRLPFAGFASHRTDAPLDLALVRRLGLVAIGRAFRADLALAAIRFF